MRGSGVEAWLESADKAEVCLIWRRIASWLIVGDRPRVEARGTVGHTPFLFTFSVRESDTYGYEGQGEQDQHGPSKPSFVVFDIIHHVYILMSAMLFRSFWGGLRDYLEALKEMLSSHQNRSLLEDGRWNLSLA